MDTEADASLRALGPVHAPVRPFRDLIEHFLVQRRFRLPPVTLGRFWRSDRYSLDDGGSDSGGPGLGLLFLQRLDPRIEHLTLALLRALLHLPNDGTDDGEGQEQDPQGDRGAGFGAQWLVGAGRGRVGGQTSSFGGKWSAWGVLAIVHKAKLTF